MSNDDQASQMIARADRIWHQQEDDLALIHDLMGGTAAMRRAGLRWLPREEAESWESWRARLNRSVLFNGFARTVATLAGRAFVRPLVLQQADPRIIALCENLDGHGGTLTSMACRMLEMLLRDGSFYLLVDRPVADAGLNLSGSAEPYLVLVEPRQVIGLRCQAAAAVSAVRRFDTGVEQIRIREEVSIPSGRFTDSMRQQVCVLEPGHWERWQQDVENHAVWSRKGHGPMGLDQVPVVACHANGIHVSGRGRARPPLMDLAWLNLAHWQSASDQRHILHVARVPILFARAMAGIDGKLEIGPNRLIMADDPAAELKFVEHSGAAIEAGRQDLLDLEEKMAVMGLDLLTSRPGNPTATGKAIEQAEANAMLGRLRLSVLEALHAGLKLAAQWMGLDDAAAGKLMLPHGATWDGGSGQTGGHDDAMLLLQARQRGDISRETFLMEIERRGILGSQTHGQADAGER